MFIQGFLSEEPLILFGMVKRGRFGNSLVNLGDLNDDGYDGKLSSLYDRWLCYVSSRLTTLSGSKTTARCRLGS